MKRSPIKRKVGLKSKKQLSRTAPIKKLGKKGVESINVKKELDKQFVEWGLINTCELQLKGCVGSMLGLTYAHSKKRSEIAKDEPKRSIELMEVVRACPACHDFIEYLPPTKEETGHEQMYRIVTTCILERKKRLNLP